MPIQSAADLWDQLNSTGRLSPNSHDKEFVAHLRKALHIPVSQDIGAYLRQHAVDVTSFLIAVLNALQPFSMMLNDIYEMFIAGGVSHSNEQLLIEFDFSESDKLSFNADAFRTARKTLAKLNNTVERRAYTPDDLRTLNNGLLRALADTLGPNYPTVFSEPIANVKAQNWITSSDWPYQTPVPLPRNATTDTLNMALAPLANLIEQLCRRTSRYLNQDDLRQACPATPPSAMERAPIDQWSEPLLAFAQQDHIARFRLLRTLWLYQQHAPRSNRNRLAQTVETLINTHSAIVPSIPLAQALDDLLDLPIWKERSQLYCVWLITLLRRELKQPGDQFQLMGQGGCLTFSFSRTSVAQVQVNHKAYELVAELSVPADGIELVGDGRVYNVQPDYALVQRQGDGTERIVYVLEAKQYAQANTRNFNHALLDYANVNPHALVALANYGAITASQPKKFADMCKKTNVFNVSERCQAFASVTPSNPTSAGQLREHFRRAVTEFAMPLPRLIVDMSDSMGYVLDAQALHTWPAIAGHIADSGMELILNLHYPQTIPSGEPTRAAMLTLFEKTKNGPMSGIYDLTKTEHCPLMLFTDNSGFHEVSADRDKLAGIITLQPDGSMVLRMNKTKESQLRRAIPGLIAHTLVGESY